MRILAIVSLLMVVLLSVASIAEQWMRGFFVLFMPYGFFTPLVILGLTFALIVSGIAAIALSWKREQSRPRRALLIAFVATLVCLPSLGSYTLHGFESRVKTVSDGEWLAIADEAREMIRSSTPGGALPQGPDADWNRRYVRRLAQSHPALRVGESLPKMFVDEKQVSFYWGSGLIGTLGVDIATSPVKDAPRPDGFFGRRRVSDHLILVWE